MIDTTFDDLDIPKFDDKKEQTKIFMEKYLKNKAMYIL